MLSERLKKSRKSMGKTQRDLAEYLGISERGYQNYEMGKREPSLEVLIQLAEYFGVTTDYLLGRVEEADEVLSQTLLNKKLYILSSDLYLFRNSEGLTPDEMARELGISEDLYRHLEGIRDDGSELQQAVY